MRAFSLALVLVFGPALTARAQDPPGGENLPAPTLKTDKDKLSYAIGMDVGFNLKRQGIEIDPVVLLRAIADVMAGEKTALTPEEAGAVVQAFQQAMLSKLADTNKQEGEAYLEENKSKPGVTTTESGLQYEVVREGKGKLPKKTDTVTTHYKGTFVDGTVFDSSYDLGQPASFQVDKVIAGWTEALQLMKVGSKWRVYIPAKLAYGERGNRAIPPNKMLIFEVELLGIEEP